MFVAITVIIIMMLELLLFHSLGRRESINAFDLIVDHYQFPMQKGREVAGI